MYTEFKDTFIFMYLDSERLLFITFKQLSDVLITTQSSHFLSWVANIFLQ